MSDVEFELILAVVLVVLVIFVFLRTLPATLIPSLSVPLSLVGTFGVMYLLNYSLDNLSLMALTISTGFVVDDAIVMIENIARYIEGGDEPLAAALKGSRQIGFTIISLTVSLIAALIPLLFMGEIVGRLFHEFAITLAVTIVISAAVSLTLVPMLCARLLRHRPGDLRNVWDLRAGGPSGGSWRATAARSRWVLDRQPLTLAVAAITLIATLALYVLIPKGFFPVQDTGEIQGISEAAQTISYRAMAERQQALAAAILKDPDVACLQFVHRRRRHQCHPEQRALSDQPQAARRTQPHGEADHPAAAVGDRRSGRHHALYAAAAGHHHRFRREPHPVSIRGREHRQRRLRGLDSEADGRPRPAAAARRRRERHAISGNRDGPRDRPVHGGPFRHHAGDGRQRAVRFVRPAQIASAIYSQSNQYRVILEADPSIQRSSRASELYLPSFDLPRTNGQVPLAAIVTCPQRPASAADHPPGAFPATTISFNLAPDTPSA